MSVQVQFRRGNTSQHSVFTGAEGEITVDTDKNVVVVHDGVTTGGYQLAPNAAYDLANTAYSLIVSAAPAGNSYADQVGAASNAWANAVTTAANNYTNAVGVAGNNYTIQVGAAANNYANSTFYTKTGGTVSGDVVITGNLTVSGITTYTNTNTLLVGDNIITLNADLPNNTSPSENAGLEVNRGSANANSAILWNESTDKWQISSNIDLGSTYVNIASNTDLENMTIAGNNYTNAVGVAGNNYAAAVGAAANNWANTKVDYVVGTAGEIFVTNSDDYNPTINLVSTGVVAATYGSATQIPTFVVDSLGRLTYAANVTVQGMDYPYTNAVGVSANSYAESVALAGNNYTNSVGVASNTYTDAVGLAGNNYTNAVGVAGNNYTNSVGLAGNNYTDAVGTAGNNYTNSVGLAGNNYTNAVGTAGNNYTDAVALAGNNYTNSVGLAGNNYTNAVGTAGNNYTNAVGASANNYANNTFFLKVGGDIDGSVNVSGNFSVTGNLRVSGNTSFISVENYRVDDPLIYLAANNYTSDIVDIGFIANYVNTGGANVHTGLYREHTDKEYYLFQGYDAEPINNHIGALSNNMTLAVLNADLRTSNLNLGGANAILWITDAYNKANDANVLAYNTGIGANAWSNTKVSSVTGTAGEIFSSGGTTPTLNLVPTAVTASTYGGASEIPVITVDTLGRLTYAANVTVQGMDYVYANQIGAASNTWANTKVSSVTGTAGEIFSSGGTTPTLNLINTSVVSSTYGGSTQIPVFTVDGQGRLTYAANVAVNGMDYPYANAVGVSANSYADATFATKASPTFTGTIDIASANIKSQILTDASSISWDLSQGTIATVTLGGNRTLSNPSNLKVGTFILHVIQDGTGGRTLGYGSAFKFPAGVAPVLTTTASARDLLSFICDGTNLYGSFLPDVK